MNVGKSFEQEFFSHLPESVYKLRLPDPAASFSSPSSLRFSNKNPYDFLLYRYPHLFALELKSRIGAISFYTEDSPTRTVDIKKWQIDGLRSASSHPGVLAGFVLNFRDKAHTYYLPIASFLSFAGSTTKKSINEKDIIYLGAFKIPKALKRTKYSFDITSMLDYAAKEASDWQIQPS